VFLVDVGPLLWLGLERVGVRLCFRRGGYDCEVVFGCFGCYFCCSVIPVLE